jgi:hypothetical protein
MSLGLQITLISLGVILILGFKVWWLMRWFKKKEQEEKRDERSE